MNIDQDIQIIQEAINILQVNTWIMLLTALGVCAVIVAALGLHKNIMIALTMLVMSIAVVSYVFYLDFQRENRVKNSIKYVMDSKLSDQSLAAFKKGILDSHQNLYSVTRYTLENVLFDLQKEKDTQLRTALLQRNVPKETTK